MSLTNVCSPLFNEAVRFPAEPKAVLFLTNVLGYGGAEVQVRQLALGFKRRGWDTTIVTMLPPQAFVDALDQAGIHLECLHMRRGIPDVRALFRLRRILRQRAPQIVHSHIVHANLLARMARLICPMPVLITTAHNTVECGRILELAYRLTDRLTDLTTNVSQAAVDRYVRIGAAPVQRIQFVPNGVDLHRFRPDKDERHRLRRELAVADQFVWLAIGRLTEAKNYPNMIEAFAQVADANTVLLIVGHGELDEPIRQHALTRHLGGRVRFLGVREDIPSLMNAADGYVLSSDWEGMPLVLQEASCTHLPIVTTDVGGNREVVVNGRTGFVVPPQDAAALAAAMRRVMVMTPEQRQQMGLAAREYMAATFDLEHVLDQWEGIYRRLATQALPAMSTS